MVKAITKWIQTASDSQDFHLLYNKVLSQIALCELSRNRSELLKQTHQEQLQKYMEMYEEQQQKTVNIKQQIADQKIQLEKAKSIKNNRIQYDLLANNIAKEPARTETNSILNNLQKEISELRDEKQRLDDLLDKRRKQFHVLSTSANKIRSLLAEDADSSIEEINASLDDITNSPGPEPMSE